MLQWSLNVAVVVQRIKDSVVPLHRPQLPEHESLGIHSNILTLMKQCWTEEPSERPSFDEVAKVLKTVNDGKSVMFYTVDIR